MCCLPHSFLRFNFENNAIYFAEYKYNTVKNMRNFLKKTTAILITIIIAIGATGCMQGEVNKSTNNDIMISYLESKYDDEFTYIDSFGGSLDGNSYQILVSSKNLPGVKITVGYYKSEGREYFTDNYLQYKFSHDIEEYLSDILEKAIGYDVIATYGISSLGTENSFTSKTTMVDFIRSSDNKLLFNAIVSYECDVDTDREQIETEIKNVLNNNDIICVADIYFANEKDKFKSFDDLSSADLDKMKKLSISMDEEGNFKRFDWR